ncbi:MMPL family transporter [Solirubrobacter soli]|uniref:MMPL family transporter n=1 Tax=Solirubrobacter soli TaxID=363832 RepID=UPI0003F9FEA5|nr:MMPL family transporter [Solirubrobacter soli]
MRSLAHFVFRHRWFVIGVWVVLTLVGVVTSGRLADRWYQSSAVPGAPAYETGQRALAEFGAGVRSPNVVVVHGDVASVDGALQRAAASMPGALAGKTYSAGDDTAYGLVYPPGQASFDKLSDAERMRAAAAVGLPAGTSVNVTGRDALDEASKQGSTGGASVLAEALIGGLGALVVLLFLFRTLPAVLMPLAVAIAAILNTFTLVWGLTHVTDVSIIVQFLIALVGLGIAIDYALLLVMRFREELRAGRDVETALEQTVVHAGRSVIVSGSTVAIGLLAMVALPLPLVRSMGIGGMLIPAVSVLASLTLLPALLAVVGTRIDSVPLLPRRVGSRDGGAWVRWSRFVVRRPVRVALIGVVVLGVLGGFGTQLNANEAPLAKFPGVGTAIEGRDQLSAAGVTPGVMKPLVVLGDAARVGGVEGVVSARVIATRGHDSLIEAFPAVDGGDPAVAGIIDRVRATGASVTGLAAVDRDFLDVLSSRMPLVLALVMGLTLILLAFAFRSIVLPIKAVLLNLVSLAAAFGVVVIVFQMGHGSGLWDVDASGSVTAWVPVMIFAFLFGLSMDYEVFMLSRMREAYDETGSTERAIELGLARTGKLVTSAALILAFAFLVLSTSPGYEIKPLAIGVAAGIVLDATVVRALLVPALMRLMGDANWWTPKLRRGAQREALSVR